MNSNKMNAIVATGYGSTDVFQFKTVAMPQPKPDEVMVKVIATTATTADAMMRTGKPYFARLFLGLTKPKNPIPGTGFAGYIEQVGEGVRDFRVGDAVFGLTTLGFGANAEFLTIRETGVILPKPANLDFAEAASYGDGHLTSFNFLKQVAKVSAGHRVLINGASGSLGTSAIQLAKYFGAEVTAVCSGKNAGLVKSLGADVVIDYTKADFTQSDQTFDFIFDTIGRSSFRKCKPILKKNGVYLSPVMKLSLLVQMMLTKLSGGKKAKFEATGLNPDPVLRTLLSQVLCIHQAGKLKTIIDRQFPLAKLADAHAYIDSGHKVGNVVILNA
ncbi:NAD(P)-dependent alcohol dehydrogenase [Salmonirosea aquatica]|uniref:Zinc-binding dehydrogenase n=1 Tax=Salmonirosea aquatica TaxID=2654236 RepID=A0A7C9FTL0_9BACT|nr:zinc-binding dehydrogenase [Cytophagaceae bacterium SJW1-29]